MVQEGVYIANLDPDSGIVILIEMELKPCMTA